jgi:hypothetical protein
MDQIQEGLIVVSIYLFFLSAVTLPVVIGWFTHQFNQRLKRLDEALDIFDETNKFYESNKDTEGS